MESRKRWRQAIHSFHFDIQFMTKDDYDVAHLHGFTHWQEWVKPCRFFPRFWFSGSIAVFEGRWQVCCTCLQCIWKVVHKCQLHNKQALCFINSAQCDFSRAWWDSFPINNGMQALFGLTVPRREEPVFVLMVLAALTQLETGALDYLNSYLTRIFMWLFTSNHQSDVFSIYIHLS